MTKYCKPAISVSDQINVLEQKGLLFDSCDKTAADRFLSYNCYYRFSGYMFIFQNRNDAEHSFKNGTDFEQILNLYDFDQDLRTLLFVSIGKIEIALKTQISNQYAMKYGSHWHLDPSLFKPTAIKKGKDGHSYCKDDYTEFINRLSDNVYRSEEQSITDYQKTYDDPLVPPVWMCLEIISIGELSFLYKILDDSKAPKIDIAKQFGLKSTRLLSKWIRCIQIVRNTCAHHGRLWNKSIPIEVLDLAGVLNPFINKQPTYKTKIYSSICCIQYLLDIIEPENQFRIELKELMRKLPADKRGDMGFVKNWDKESFWK
ncbi:hypothetical protein MsAg5_08590 [Methanosarcinaceae archaeon Ag5]|uniref:Abi family protein n=1 Tax=Methanolapillus africanus TaxID=3028297 RepID=A0AAE4MJG1_9EURY|nr:hypothetical protein [Methanosarcinaceae archaeon Ag5]